MEGRGSGDASTGGVETSLPVPDVKCTRVECSRCTAPTSSHKRNFLKSVLTNCAGNFIILEELIVAELVRKFTAAFGSRKLVIVSTIAVTDTDTSHTHPVHILELCLLKTHFNIITTCASRSSKLSLPLKDISIRLPHVLYASPTS
jgi:hypothetical protein